MKITAENLCRLQVLSLSKRIETKLVTRNKEKEKFQNLGLLILAQIRKIHQLKDLEF